ncbi:hypothetical protein FB45DRAFT_866921 [Roridomyces roridus]|uniref:Uncharacterized protein n=1 Tax=Roridomyces roridus TaxID=1738132 RepID=A0AAD7BTG4_9AGAR|nr:hypothetical protein FB45DRAFT_866921 [Roridomyces roridus]
MAPKPRPLHRKASISKNPAEAAIKSEQDAKAMPPPPAPVPAGILVPEVTALATCLKNAAVKTGQIYAFYADTRKLGIQNYAPAPPQSLTAALGREVEKYDQLCDSIESQLLRAISLLQRDLAQEERRIKQAEAEAEAKANSIAGRTRSASRSPTSTRIPLPALDIAAVADSSRPSIDPALSPPPLSSTSMTGRRQSTISMTSLQRPGPPLKLDLTALQAWPPLSSLLVQRDRMVPNELPPDLIAALASASASASSAMATVGNSADKPIELDLDAMEIDMAMSDLFGDTESGSNNAGSAVDSLFTPVVSGPDIALTRSLGDVKKIKEEDNFLSALGGGEGEDIFGSLRAGAPGNTHPTEVSAPSNLLASFSNMGDPSGSNASGENTQPYDLEGLDLSNLSPGFFADAHNTDMAFDMEQLLGMGEEGQETQQPKMEP